jgi:hypothetical protein
MNTVPAYVDWQACRATPLSRIRDFKVRLKLSPVVINITVVLELQLKLKQKSLLSIFAKKKLRAVADIAKKNFADKK